MTKPDTFLAVWPDEKISIVQARDLHSLYNDLETIGPVEKCHYKRLDGTENLCLTFKPVTTIKTHGDDIADYCGAFPNTQVETMERYEELLKTGELSDVTIHAGSLQLKCHRLILSVQCPYFAAMFRSACSEQTLGEVHIKSFSPQIVRTVIQYLYSGKVDVKRETLVSYYKEETEAEEMDSVVAASNIESSSNITQKDTDKEHSISDTPKSDSQTQQENESYESDVSSSDESDRVEYKKRKSKLYKKIGAYESLDFIEVDEDGESSWCDFEQSRVVDIKMGLEFWRDLYLAADYFSLPSLQEVCKVHLCSLCYQVKQLMKSHEYCACTEDQTILQLTVPLFQLGSQLPGLSRLQSLACQLVKTFTQLHTTAQESMLKKATMICEIIPDEMKNKILSPGETKSFLTSEHLEWTALLDNSARCIEESVLQDLQLKVQTEDNCTDYLNDVNCLHMTLRLYQCCYEPRATIDINQHFYKLLSTLLEVGVDVNKTDELGNTPLHIAAVSFNRTIVQKLLDFGADVTSVNNAGRLPLEEAWYEFDGCFVGDILNSQDTELGPEDYVPVQSKAMAYKETASLLMEKMVVSGSKHKQKKLKNRDLESVSSDFIDECLREPVQQREFQLVQNAGNLCFRFMQHLSETLYPNVSNSMRSVDSKYHGREGNKKVQDTIKKLYREASLQDLSHEDLPRLASLHTRTMVKCRNSPNNPQIYTAENCDTCVEILGGSGTPPVIPQDVLNIHGNIRKFWL